MGFWDSHTEETPKTQLFLKFPEDAAHFSPKRHGSIFSPSSLSKNSQIRRGID